MTIPQCTKSIISKYFSSLVKKKKKRKEREKNLSPPPIHPLWKELQHQLCVRPHHPAPASVLINTAVAEWECIQLRHLELDEWGSGLITCSVFCQEVWMTECQLREKRTYQTFLVNVANCEICAGLNGVFSSLVK